MSNFNKYLKMKNLVRKSMIAIGLLMSLSTLANRTEMPFKEKEKKVTSMHFENVQKGSILYIKDQNGLVLYNEAIERNGDYSKGFDLTSLPDGDYIFELNSDLKIDIIPFNVRLNKVLFDKDSEESIYKPVVRTKDNMVYVSRTVIDQTPLSYKIYYADNYDLIDTAEFEELEEVKKVYDFSSSEKGNYIFEFESKGRKYTKMIRI